MAIMVYGHHARECTNAWIPAAGTAPETRGSAANPPGSASASAAAPADPVVPPHRPASVDVPTPVADPPDPSDASAVDEAEMPDGEYVPSTDDDRDPSSMDAVAASGDDEVVLAVSPPSSSDSPRRRRKRRRRTVSSAVPSVLVDMDTSEVEVPGHKQFKTFRGVWEDVVSWEELRSRKSRYRVVVTPHEPSSTPSLFPSQSIFHQLFLQMVLLLILCRPLLLSVHVLRLTLLTGRATGIRVWIQQSFCSVLAELLGEFGRSVSFLGRSCSCCSVFVPFCGFLTLGVLSWSTVRVALFP